MMREVNGQTSFNTLLDMNAIRIVEKIFLLLDTVSLEKCHHVCKAWNGVLSSEVFKRKKAAVARKMWTNAENLYHQVWARFSRSTPLQWAVNGEEVAYITQGSGILSAICTFINREGERKNCEYSSWGMSKLWILEKTILTDCNSYLRFIDKQNMTADHLEMPKAVNLEMPEYDHVRHFTHFSPTAGLSIATMPAPMPLPATKPGNFIWLGHISKSHRQGSLWPSDFAEDFVTDGDGSSYFARVYVGNLTMGEYSFKYDWAEPAFNEDGTRFFFRDDGAEQDHYLHVFALERENSRYLWRTALTGLDDFIHANAQSMFILRTDGVIRIQNIDDGSVVRIIALQSLDDVQFWWRKIASNDTYLLAFLPDQPPHGIHQDHEPAEDHGNRSNALDPDLLMIKQDTFDVKKHLIRESTGDTLIVRSLPPQTGPGGFGLIEEKIIAVAPMCRKEEGIKKLMICHLDLEARKVFNSLGVTQSRVPFGMDLINPDNPQPLLLENPPPLVDQPNPYGSEAALPEGFIFHVSELIDDDVAPDGNLNRSNIKRWIKDFHEVCTGVYIIEYSVEVSRLTMPGGQVFGGAHGGMQMNFLEIISWKCEEIPRALKEFLNEKFQSI